MKKSAVIFSINVFCNANYIRGGNLFSSSRHLSLQPVKESSVHGNVLALMWTAENEVKLGFKSWDRCPLFPVVYSFHVIVFMVQAI